jgi:hypothetical protein
MPALLEPADLLKRLLENLGEVVFVLLFVGLPILRGVFEARRRRERDRAQGGSPPARTGPPPGRPDADLEREGRERWERLLRGETPEPEAAPAPPDAAPQRAPAAPMRPALDPSPGLDPSLPPYLDEEAAAESVVSEAVEAASRWTRAGLEGVPLPSIQSEGTAPSTADERRARPIAVGFDLRQAVLASEILGPPLALRREAVGASTPPGLMP